MFRQVNKKLVREPDPCAATEIKNEKKLRRELAKVAAMHGAAQERLVGDPSRQAYWCQMWESDVLNAADRERVYRKRFVWARSIALTSTLLVTTLAGISVSATGPWSTLVRFATLALGLVSAVSTGITALFGWGERWLLKRRLRSDLMAAAWKFINNRSDQDEAAWGIFLEETGKARRDYDQQYQSIWINSSLKNERNKNSDPADESNSGAK